MPKGKNRLGAKCYVINLNELNLQYKSERMKVIIN